MEPETNNARTVESYELIADDYARETAGSRVMSGALARLAEAVPGGHVLEIGSGPGWDADQLEEAGLTVRRTDITQAFIDQQRARGKEVDRLDAINDDLGGPYDAVVAIPSSSTSSRRTTCACCRRSPLPCGPAAASSSPSPSAKASAWEVGRLRQPYYRVLRLGGRARRRAGQSRTRPELERPERQRPEPSTTRTCRLDHACWLSCADAPPVAGAAPRPRSAASSRSR